MSEANKALVRRFVEECFNQMNIDAVAGFVVPELLEGVRDHVREILDAFTDLHVTIEDLFGEEDRVVARVTISGVHTGPFAGAAPSNERVTWASIRIWRFEDGRCAETWAMQDRLGLLTQLGLVDPVAEPIHWAAG